MKSMRRSLVVAAVCAAGLMWTARAATLDQADVEARFEALRTYTYGDDRVVLQAVNELINRSAHTPDARRHLEEHLADFLAGEATPDAKAFACEMLARIGTAHSVPVLAGLLADPELSLMARLALEHIPEPEVEDALISALDSLEGELLIGVISSLGNRGAVAAVEPLGALLDGGDRAQNNAIVAALGQIRGHEAYSILAGTLPESVDVHMRDSAMLRCAEAFAAAGAITQAARAFEDVFESGSTPSIRPAGYMGLAGLLPERASELTAVALDSDSPALRGAALRWLRTSPPDPEVTNAVAQLLPQADAESQALLLYALADRGDPVAQPSAVRAISSDAHSVRTAALEALGALGTAEDVPLLIRAVQSGPEDHRIAAQRALTRLQADGVEQAITAAVAESESGAGATLIEVLVARNARQHQDVLLEWARSHSDTTIAGAAAKAFGSLAPPERLAELLDVCLEVQDETRTQNAAAGVWEMVRRAPDPEKAVAMLAQASENAPEQARTRLEEVKDRAQKELVMLRTAPMTIDHPNLPKGYLMAAYVNCGRQRDSGDHLEGHIALVTGDSYTFSGIQGPLADVAFDAEAVQYEITGLDADTEYLLGFTWWDADNGGRVQSVRFGTGEPVEWSVVLPPTPAAAFHIDTPTWAHVLLPITPEFHADGRLTVAFTKEAGPNAVVNELWLLKNGATAPRKRVLIVTGDDHPGHRWRETAPELARILREDPRLEVAVTEAPAIYGSPLMTHYDATVLHFKNYADRLPLGAEIGEELKRFAEAGLGVVIAHFGSGAFQEWDGFERLAGRIWNPELPAHDPYGTFTVRIEDSTHPVTRGMTDFTVVDELYTCLDGQTEIRVLCAATSVVDQKDYPMAFEVPGFPRVFHTPLGHGVESMQSEGMRALYRRAAAWAAGFDPEIP